MNKVLMALMINEAERLTEYPEPKKRGWPKGKPRGKREMTANKCKGKGGKKGKGK